MSSPFWKYFRDSLRWPQIWRPGPLSAVVKGLALHMDDVREDIIWLRRQWNPATADAEMIARYGESRGIIRWRFDTDESYRRRVINAFAWHKLGGKVRGLERIFAENLYLAEVLPSSDPALWAHFRLSLDVTETGFDDQSGPLAFWLANEYKPARSVLEGVITKSRTPLEECVGVALRSRTVGKSRLWFAPPEPPSLTAGTAVGMRGRIVTETRLHFVPPLPPRMTAHAGAAVRGRTVADIPLHFVPPVPPAQSIAPVVGLRTRTTTNARLSFVPPPAPKAGLRTSACVSSITGVRLSVHFPLSSSSPGRRTLCVALTGITSTRVASRSTGAAHV